jgi:hypothetical protein
MITVEKLGVILSPTNLDFENNGVINPGIWMEIPYIFCTERYKKEIITIGYAK